MKTTKHYQEISDETLGTIKGGSNIVRDTIDYVVGFVKELFKP